MPRLLRLIRYVAPYWLPLFASVVLMAMVGLLEAFRLLLIGPILGRVLEPVKHKTGIILFTLPLSGRAVDLGRFVPSAITNDWAMVAYALIISTMLKGLCDYTGTYLVNYSGLGMIMDLRNQLHDAVLRRSASFFQRYSTGTLLSTIINDVERVQYAMSTVLAEFLQQFFTFLFMVVLVVLLGKKLAWVLVLFIPVVVISAGRIGRRVRHTTRKGQDKLAEIQNILHETITGNRIVKAFSMERWEISRFRTAARRLLRANLRSVAAQAISSPLMDVIGAIAIAMLLWIGRNLIMRHLFTGPAFVTFLVVVFKLYDPVRKFAQFNNNFQSALGASSEIFRFMDEQDEVLERPNAARIPGFSRGIRLEDVSFAYQDESGELRTVLDRISLDVERGEVLAIVGSSGAGKSTLVNLLPRFFDVTGGSILLDGLDIRDITIDSLRAQFGIVTQETILFNDTVRNNIAYGHPETAEANVLAAAQAALAHDFILRMPDGYNTVIGEKGLRLSGGERQRIAIARALLKNAPILILDEATSALDAESESLVQSALQNLMANRTVFVIAHRLSTVRRADRIMVLEDGKIADIGSHDALLARMGTYKRLYELQSAEAPSR